MGTGKLRTNLNYFAKQKNFTYILTLNTKIILTSILFWKHCIIEVKMGVFWIVKSRHLSLHWRNDWQITKWRRLKWIPLCWIGIGSLGTKSWFLLFQETKFRQRPQVYIQISACSAHCKRLEAIQLRGHKFTLCLDLLSKDIYKRIRTL